MLAILWAAIGLPWIKSLSLSWIASIGLFIALYAVPYTIGQIYLCRRLPRTDVKISFQERQAVRDQRIRPVNKVFWWLTALVMLAMTLMIIASVAIDPSVFWLFGLLGIPVSGGLSALAIEAIIAKRRLDSGAETGFIVDPAPGRRRLNWAGGILSALTLSVLGVAVLLDDRKPNTIHTATVVSYKTDKFRISQGRELSFPTKAVIRLPNGREAVVDVAPRYDLTVGQAVKVLETKSRKRRFMFIKPVD